LFALSVGVGGGQGRLIEEDCSLRCGQGCNDIVEVFDHRLSGSEDGYAIFLAVMRIPVVDIVLELGGELVDLVGPEA
jgi:hypothetical protein